MFNGIDLLVVLGILLALYLIVLWGVGTPRGGCYTQLQRTSHTDDEVYDWERDGL